VSDVRDISHTASEEKLGTVKSELSPAPELVNSGASSRLGQKLAVGQSWTVSQKLMAGQKLTVG
jgi:hypothetical protein